MLKKLVLTFLMGWVMFIAQAVAQSETQTQISPEKTAAIKELVALLDVGNNAQAMAEAMDRQMSSVLTAVFESVINERPDLTEAEKKSLREIFSAKQDVYVKRFRDKLIRKLNYAEMITEIAVIVYDKW